MVRKKLHSIRFQALILFIPVINFFVTSISASSNMRKLKENSIIVVFPLIIICNAGIWFMLTQLLQNLPLINENIEKILFYIAAYMFSFLMSLGFFLYHRFIINKRIYNGEIVIENSKMYLIS